MKHIWSILCQKSSIDSETNQISLFNAVEELQIKIEKQSSTETHPQKIHLPVSMELISLWQTTPYSKDTPLNIRLEILDPQENIVTSITPNFIIEKGKKRFRSRIKMQGFLATTQGEYLFRIWKKEKKEDFLLIKEIPLEVMISYVQKLK